MQYQAENKLPIFWGAAGLLAYLSLGPIAAAAVALMWQSRVQRQVCIERGWIVPPDYFPTLPAVDVQALPMSQALDVPAAAVDALVSEPVTTPSQVQHPSAPGVQPIAVHSHSHITNVIPSGNAATSATKTAAPPQADRQTVAPDLGIYESVPDRMNALLNAMEADGCPLGRLINHPFVWAYGRSQSGKTTIVSLLAAARMALGHQIEYASMDEDIEPLRWSNVALGPLSYADRAEHVAVTIRGATKGSLAGHGFIFDELLASYADLGIDLNPLLLAVLTKGSKTRCNFVGISHADTSGSHGLSGIDAAWREERISIQAIHTEDARGERSPSGRYLVSNGPDSEEWAIPTWMLTMCNSYGVPCPVVWLLSHFPELRQGRTQSPPAPSTTAPKWASMGMVQTPVQSGSEAVQARFSGSGMVQGSNHGSEAVQGLNPSELGTFGDLNLNGSGFMNRFEPAEPPSEPANPSQFFTNLNLNRSDAIDRISGLKAAGLNQGQIILALWGCPKGGSKAYTEAVSQYKELMGD